MSIKHFIDDPLDDDARMKIADALSQGDGDEITNSICQQPYTPPITHKALQKASAATQQFCSQMASELTLSAMPSKTTRAIKWRFILSLALSLSLWFLLAPSVLAIIHVPNFLFFGAALSPVWWLLGKTVQQGYEWIKQRVNKEARTHIDLGLGLVKNNQDCIQYQLSTGILDVAHFDIEALERVAMAQLKHIWLSIEQLSVLPWRERCFKDVSVQTSKQALVEKLKAQERTIKLTLKKIAEHIPDRVKSCITQLQIDLENNIKLTPKMQVEQLVKLKQFIEKWGSPKAAKAFDRNTDLIRIFAKHLKSKKLIYAVENHNLLNTPWGQFRCLADRLAGWGCLVNSFMLEGERSDAMLRVLSLLEGKITLTTIAFDQTMGVLQNDLDGLLRAHLFWLLDSDLHARSTALLLKPEHKKIIGDWCLENQTEIIKAQRLMTQAFGDKGEGMMDGWADSELARVFSLVDAADLLSESPTKNLAREYFKHYQGESILAHSYLRFIPLSSRTMLTKQVANQRLQWLIEQTHVAPVSDFPDFKEICLFKDNNLNVAPDKWDFDEQLTLLFSAPAYQRPWTQSMTLFLEKSKESGLGLLGGRVSEKQAGFSEIKNHKQI